MAGLCFHMVHPEQLLCHSHGHCGRICIIGAAVDIRSYPSPQNLPFPGQGCLHLHLTGVPASRPYDRIGAVHIQHHRLFQLPAGKCTGRLDHSLAFSSKGSAHHRFDHPDFRIGQPQQAADVKAHLIYRLAWGPQNQISVFINIRKCDMGLQSSVMDFLGASRRRHNDGCLSFGLIIFSKGYFLLKSHRIFRLSGRRKADYRRLLPVCDFDQAHSLLHRRLGFPHDKRQMISDISCLIAQYVLVFRGINTGGPVMRIVGFRRYVLKCEYSPDSRYAQRFFLSDTHTRMCLFTEYQLCKQHSG